MSKPHTASTRSVLNRLHESRFVFTTSASRQKEEALELLAGRTIRAPGHLKKLHRTLCYLLAYPDNARVYRRARALLDSFGERVGSLSPAARRILENSGIQGTTVRLDFSYDVAQWLRELPGVEIDWESYESPEELDPILRETISRSEMQIFDDGDITTPDWIHRAKGRLPLTDLAWLWLQMERHIPSRSIREELYDKAAVPLVWHLSGSPPICRLPVTAPFYHPGGILRFRADARREIARPLKGLRPVSRARGRDLIRTTVANLAARHREVYADGRGNPDEVYDVNVGRGARVVVIGVKPEHRLLLEGNYGYLLLKNGMAVGYGGVSPLFHQANTGINIFEEYRRGEAAFLFVQTLRVFHALFGSTRFILNAYQAGGGNKEAIASGAFWFYHKLHFRPTDPATRNLAERERTRLKKRTSYRTSPAALRQLAGSDLELHLPGARREHDFVESWLGVCAAGATRLIAEESCPDRSEAVARIVRRIQRDLGVKNGARWPPAERRAFKDMAPLIGLIENMAAWKPAAKRRLVRLMRAKGAQRERGYILALRQNDSLRRALAAYCRRQDRQ